eukprot:gene10802-16951_t
MGHGMPLRSGIFDGAISISAVQWLCNADKTGHDPKDIVVRKTSVVRIDIGDKL